MARETKRRRPASSESLSPWRPSGNKEPTSRSSEKNPRKLEFFGGPCESEAPARNWSPIGDSAADPLETRVIRTKAKIEIEQRSPSGIRETEKEHREGTRRRRRRRGGDGARDGTERKKQ